MKKTLAFTVAFDGILCGQYFGQHLETNCAKVSVFLRWRLFGHRLGFCSWLLFFLLLRCKELKFTPYSRAVERWGFPSGEHALTAFSNIQHQISRRICLILLVCLIFSIFWEETWLKHEKISIKTLPLGYNVINMHDVW